MRMRRAILALTLVGLVMTTGCLGSVSPAHLTDGDLSSSSWRKADEERGSLVLGMGELAVLTYNQGGLVDLLGIKVATVNDLPIIDERERLVPIALEKVEEEEGISLEERGSVDLRLVNLDATVTGTEYNVRGAGVPAKAVLFTPACHDFVVVVAYGATTDGGSGGPLGGGGGSDPGYQEARDFARRVVCGS